MHEVHHYAEDLKRVRVRNDNGIGGIHGLQNGPFRRKQKALYRELSVKLGDTASRSSTANPDSFLTTATSHFSGKRCAACWRWHPATPSLWTCCPGSGPAANTATSISTLPKSTRCHPVARAENTMNNPIYVCNTHPADDQSSAGHFLMAGETGAGKTVLVMSLIKDLLNQHTDGERHD